MLLGHEKISFLNLPTPLEYLPTISKELGVEFWIKRDDLTNLGLGGNKLRKLEYILADAKKQGATMLLTLGGAQTNHGRLTAAVAAKYGMKCAIVCVDEYPGEMTANILLDRLMGAEVVFKKPDTRAEGVLFAEAAATVKARYEAQGEKVYEIPIGGSNEVGILGYYECAIEITSQAQERGLEDATVYCGVGSIGTYMGLYCGLRNEGSTLGLTGVAISPFLEDKEFRLIEFFEQVKAAYGLKINARDDFHIEKGYTRGGYNNPCKEVREAICKMARTEGVLLDPCYTGKAFAGILDMVRDGKIVGGSKIIFLHTGGIPGLYTKHHRLAFEQELLDGITILP